MAETKTTPAPVAPTNPASVTPTTTTQASTSEAKTTPVKRTAAEALSHLAEVEKAGLQYAGKEHHNPYLYFAKEIVPRVRLIKTGRNEDGSEATPEQIQQAIDESFTVTAELKNFQVQRIVEPGLYILPEGSIQKPVHASGTTVLKPVE